MSFWSSLMPKIARPNKVEKVAALGIDKEELKSAESYISRQIVEGIVVPNVVSDEEAIDLILDLSPKDAAQFCQSNIEHGAFTQCSQFKIHF